MLHLEGISSTVSVCHRQQEVEDDQSEDSLPFFCARTIPPWGSPICFSTMLRWFWHWLKAESLKKRTSACNLEMAVSQISKVGERFQSTAWRKEMVSMADDEFNSCQSLLFELLDRSKTKEQENGFWNKSGPAWISMLKLIWSSLQRSRCSEGIISCWTKPG